MSEPKTNTVAKINPQFGRKTDEWATPQELFDNLNAEFKFSCDVAATAENAKCETFITKEEDALTGFGWMNVNWCNPPYSKTKEFVIEASNQQQKGKLTVMLIPARTDTKLFHDYIYDKLNVEVRFLKGRLKFIHPDGALLRGTTMNGSNDAAPFPSMVVIFHPTKRSPEALSNNQGSELAKPNDAQEVK